MRPVEDKIQNCAEQTPRSDSQSLNKTGKRTTPISRLRFKVSDLSDEQKDKLLFEVFDLLLRNDAQPGRVRAPLASESEKCRVKKKASESPHRKPEP